MLYNTFCTIWQLIGSIFGIIVLYALVMAVIEKIGGRKNDIE